MSADRLEYQRAWRAANKEKVAGYHERYREKHPEVIHRLAVRGCAVRKAKLAGMPWVEWKFTLNSGLVFYSRSKTLAKARQRVMRELLRPGEEIISAEAYRTL